MMRDRLTILFLILLASLVSSGCGIFPDNSDLKLPVAQSAQILRGAADAIEMHDLDKDGFIENAEWASLAIALYAQYQAAAQSGPR